MQQDIVVRRRVGIGRNWIGEDDKKTEEPPILVRSGVHVVEGRIIGDKKHPTAFVWIDEAANDPKRELIICPDIEGGWLWENGLATSLEVAFPDNKALLRFSKKFDYWLQFLKEHWDTTKSQRFFWGRFHDEGLGLARKLQTELVKEAVVRYWRPSQDSQGSIQREIPL